MGRAFFYVCAPPVSSEMAHDHAHRKRPGALMSARHLSHNIIHVSPGALTPRGNNPRTHSKKQIRQIANCIRRFGFTNPVLVDAKGGIIAGHGRVEAAMLLGLETIPTIQVDAWSEAEIRAYVIADNKLAENAGWDRNLLALELQFLSALDLSVDLDVSVTGFEMGEIDVLIGELSAENDAADAVPEVDVSAPAVTRPGDLWQIGPHRLFCGDATKTESYAALLGAEKAQMVFTDPPYNVAIDGHVCGLGAVKHREFAMAAGEMSKAQFTGFLASVFGNLAKAGADGAIHFICMDWRHMGEVLAAGEGVYSELKNLCVWAKTNGGMGSLYRSQHELVFVFKAGTAAHINNVELGKHGRYRTNVWSYAGINSFGKTRDEELASHPTVKPVKLVADAIQDCSKRKGIVLDAFAGSGTTLVAAHSTGRRGYGLELDPHYCDVIVKRMAAATGLKLVHAASGKTFDELAVLRAANPEAA
jgi:16S rRNA G966 N2-methylase RsmD